MAIHLRNYQLDALKKMKTGCILNGGVGSGKSLTALAYYYIKNGGSSRYLTGGAYSKMKKPVDLYIITTAKKRDTHEWEAELSRFLLSPSDEISMYRNKIVIDSWNNITKYVGAVNSFFIFDEQRVVGSGAWAKAFQKIAKKNDWILLSATPGDTWSDYIPVFLANGFYRNKTEFTEQHIVYDYRVRNFPKILRYQNTGRLIRLRDSILIDMDFKRKTVPHHLDVVVPYDIPTYKDVMKRRWNIWDDRPIENAGELCYALRKIVNSDPSRAEKVLEIAKDHPRVIIFYNFDYELDILKDLDYGKDVVVAEWNGHKHHDLPESDKWVYLVQYTAGCEGWNCIKTDTIVFYSQNYSYKVVAQASGRIDRMNTPFTDLYYFHIRSKSSIDLAISRALSTKKKFNEGHFVKTRKEN